MTQNTPTRVVQTIALAYANGDLHVGHLVEAIFADCHARHRRARGDDVVFLGADDCHGTPIEIKAAAQNQTPQELIADIGARHRADYAAFDISFDHYHSTDSPENEALCAEVYRHMQGAGLIDRRNVAQLFDPDAGRFLSDRHVKGGCPKCGALDQYGDNCEACGATYQATELAHPVSTLTGATLVIADSEHLFFRVSALEPIVRAWAQSGTLQSGVLAKISDWFNDGLRDWDISRDAPYFGFPIPDEPGKFFYVWLDAPLGYIASLIAYLNATGSSRTWRDDWGEGSDTEIIHHIGKDIISFHAVFWPALLTAGKCRLPSRVQAHGFLTVEGAKMSKSRGTFLLASDLAAHVDSDAVRYALLSRLGDFTTDIDFSARDVVDRVNAELVGKIANIPVRLRGLVQDPEAVHLSDTLLDPALWAECAALADDAVAQFHAFEPGQAIRRIVDIATRTNGFIQSHAPWAQTDLVARNAVTTQALCQFRLIAALLQPVSPRFAQRCLAVFGTEAVAWADLSTPVLGTTAALPTHLMDRLDAGGIAALFNQPATPKEA
ncbi:methionine--tRNA ligase [uncultured Tateyamaria sp.]|uniref:methionine--tRNA ligase n=1 Tax=uncultured Tateyamaria sp. TaxID=455651 RepID=UPI00262901CE|nr:methionine--tRNA ligase [uncultured Tateyamaria sp.]